MVQGYSLPLIISMFIHVMFDTKSYPGSIHAVLSILESEETAFQNTSQVIHPNFSFDKASQNRTNESKKRKIHHRRNRHSQKPKPSSALSYIPNRFNPLHNLALTQFSILVNDERLLQSLTRIV